MEQWWYNVKTGQVEPDDNHGPNRDVLGPYETQEEASRALEIARERTEKWDREDREWEARDSSPSQSPLARPAQISGLRRLSRLNPPTIEGNDPRRRPGDRLASRSCQSSQTGGRADQVLGQVQAVTRATRREQPGPARR